MCGTQTLEYIFIYKHRYIITCRKYNEENLRVEMNKDQIQITGTGYEKNTKVIMSF